MVTKLKPITLIRMVDSMIAGGFYLVKVPEHSGDFIKKFFGSDYAGLISDTELEEHDFENGDVVLIKIRFIKNLKDVTDNERLDK